MNYNQFTISLNRSINKFPQQINVYQQQRKITSIYNDFALRCNSLCPCVVNQLQSTNIFNQSINQSINITQQIVLLHNTYLLPAAILVKFHCQSIKSNYNLNK